MDVAHNFERVLWRKNKAGIWGYVSGEIALPPWNKVKKENVL